MTAPSLSEVLRIHSSTRRILIKMAIVELQRRAAEWRQQQDRDEEQCETPANRRSKRMSYIAQRSIYNACADANKQEWRSESESEADALAQSLLLLPNDSMQSATREMDQTPTLPSGCILQEIKSKTSTRRKGKGAGVDWALDKYDEAVECGHCENTSNR